MTAQSISGPKYKAMASIPDCSNCIMIGLECKNTFVPCFGCALKGLQLQSKPLITIPVDWDIMIPITFHCIYDFPTQSIETACTCNEHFQKRCTVTTNTSNPAAVKGGRTQSSKVWPHGCALPLQSNQPTKYLQSKIQSSR